MEPKEPPVITSYSIHYTKLYEDARLWASRLAANTGGALVPLGREEDAARVVARGITVDFSAFRLGAKTIVDDLGFRDLSINAMAVRLDPLLVQGEQTSDTELPLIDPSYNFV